MILKKIKKIHSNKNLSGFTYAELMVSLVIIAVITVVLYPTISDLSPNNNKFLFKSTYKTMGAIISEITSTSTIPTGADAERNLCREFAKRLNVKTQLLDPCNQAGVPARFQTTNGVRWFFEYSGANLCASNPVECHQRIWVDVNASNNNVANIILNTDGSPTLPNVPAGLSEWTAGNARGIFFDKSGTHGAEGNPITQDTFPVVIRNDGRMLVYDRIGRDHLIDEE